jgi:hypothetical protein
LINNFSELPIPIDEATKVIGLDRQKAFSRGVLNVQFRGLSTSTAKPEARIRHYNHYFTDTLQKTIRNHDKKSSSG